MKARDVMAEAYMNDTCGRGLTGVMLDCLLAQTPPGEGVYIAPDGTLMRYVTNDSFGVTLSGMVPIEGADRD